MPIDSNIYFQQQPIRVDDQLNKLAAIGQIQQSQNQNQLAQLQFSRAQRQDANEAGQNKAFADATDPVTGKTDYNKVSANLAAGGFGSAIPTVQKSAAEAQKAQREAEKASLENAIQKQAIVAQVAGAVTDQASWAAGKSHLASLGIDVSQVPDQYDPALAKQLQMRALTGVQQLDQHWKQMNYDLDVRKVDETGRHNVATEKNASAAVGATLRGQDLTDARARDLLAQGKTPPGYRANADGTMSAIPGGPADIKNSKEGAQRTQDAKDVLSIADEAEKLLPKASNGYLSQGANMAAGALGMSTNAAQADAQLRVLQGALVSKMPKMSGPQSDKDVLLYQQMAGQIGDPSVPVKQRQAALQTVRKLQQKYLGQDSSPAAPASDGWSVTEVK